MATATAKSKGKVITAALLKNVTDQQKKYIDNVQSTVEVDFASAEDVQSIIEDFNVEE